MLNICKTYKIRLEAAFGGFCPKPLLKSFSPEKLLSNQECGQRAGGGCRAQSFNQNLAGVNISHLNGGRHVARPYRSHPRDAFASHRSFTPDVAPLFKENYL